MLFEIGIVGYNGNAHQQTVDDVIVQLEDLQAMSLLSMRRKMASKRTASIILWLLIAVFAVTAVFWSMNPSQMKGKKGAYVGDDKTVIATVNGKEVYAGDLNIKYNGVEDNPNPDKPTSPKRHYFTQAMQERQSAFDEVVKNTVQEDVFSKMGIRLWPWTVRNYLRDMAKTSLFAQRENMKKEAADAAAKAKTPDEKKKLKTADVMYQEFLKKAADGLGVKDKKNPTDDDLIKAFVTKATSDAPDSNAAQYETMVKSLMLGEKVLKSVPGVSPLSEAYVQKLYTKDVKASWIFLAAKDSTPKSLEEAQQRAQQLHDDIVKNPATFAAKAKAQSNDMMTAIRGGDLGWITGYMPSQTVQPTAEYLAYTLEKNSISQIMLIAMPGPSGGSQVGYAFAKVNDIRDRPSLKDFDWNASKEMAMLSVKFRYSQIFGQNYMDIERAKAKIVRLSKELMYYEAQADPMTKPADLDSKRTALLGDPTVPPEVIASIKVSQLTPKTDPRAAADILDSVIQYAPADMQTNMEMQLANYCIASGQKSRALDQVRNVAAAVESPDSDKDSQIHAQLKKVFEKLGAKEDIKHMAEWLKAHPAPPKPPAGSMPASMPPMNMSVNR